MYIPVAEARQRLLFLLDGLNERWYVLWAGNVA